MNVKRSVEKGVGFKYVWVCVENEITFVTDGDPISTNPKICDRFAPHNSGCHWDLRAAWGNGEYLLGDEA